MVKSIIVNERNKDRINDLIKEAENKATVRTLTYDALVDAIDEYVTDIGITKKSLENTTIIIDVNAQEFPSAYKYTPHSTECVVTLEKGKWRLYSVGRHTCSRVKYLANLSDTAKNALIEKYTRVIC